MDTLLRVEGAGLRGAAGRALAETPRRLVLSGAVTGVLVAAWVAMMVAGFSAARGGMAAMSSAAGEVDATNDLYFRLNDMDAQAADALLVGFHPTIAVPAAVNAQASVSTYETDRRAADRDVQTIAANPALSDACVRLLDALGGYEALIGQALYVDQNAATQSPASPPAAALSAYQSASLSMHGTILQIASGITGADSKRVDDGYAADVGDARLYAVLTAVAALAVVAALGATHGYLARRFRRKIAPALAAAVVAALAVAGSGVETLLHEAQQFKIAKQDAFDSINALTRARAVSYDANADESRWLLDRTAELQASFFDKASQVAAVPGVDAPAAAANPAAYYDGLKSAVAQVSVDPGANRVTDVKVGGFLGSELDNITFPDEAQGAGATIRAYQAYIQDDAIVRGDADRGDLAGAVTVDVGTQPGQSNYTYYQYDQALTHIIAINEGAFHAAIADGQARLGAWTWLPYGAGAALLGLLGAALYPRLREYR